MQQLIVSIYIYISNGRENQRNTTPTPLPLCGKIMRYGRSCGPKLNTKSLPSQPTLY